MVRFIKFPLAVLIAFAVASAGFAPKAAAQTVPPLPPAPGAHVANISPPNTSGSEPSIAVDPNNPSHVVAVYQRATVNYSTDGGMTFTQADIQPPDGWKEGGDVSTTFDSKGHAFLSSLHFDKLGTAGYWAHGAGRNGIFVRRSLDGGKTWEKDAVAVKAWKDGDKDIQWEDMPRIFADNVSTSPYAGNLYVGWIEWRIEDSIILFARSTDAGKTFSAPFRISTKAGLPRDDNGGLVGFIGGVDSDGTIYVSWNDGNSIVMAVSHDGGKSFDPSRSVVPVAPPYFGGAVGIPGVSRAMGFAQIAVDPRPGKGGRLMVAWSDFSNGDIDVFSSTSEDHGKTWTPRMRVNNDPVHDGIDQFFQWIAIDPITGDAYVQFYDRRGDPENRKTWVTLARSTDGGRTWTNYAWTDKPFASEIQFLGDYMWCTAYNNKVYGIWTEALPPDPTAPAGPDGRRRGSSMMRVGYADFTVVK